MDLYGLKDHYTIPLWLVKGISMFRRVYLHVNTERLSQALLPLLDRLPLSGL